MNVSSFFDHWGIAENPFRAEEARHDAVFERLGLGPTTHPDFEKILGDPARPATSIVFGEKGSGKTAIRMQIAQRTGEWNELRPESRVMLITYDDLNPVLDRFYARMQQSGVKTVDEALKKQLRLRAARHGRSVEDEVRTILRSAAAEDAPVPAAEALL